MRDPIEPLALFDDAPEGDRAAVEAALVARPELAEAFARWRSLRAAVRADLARDLPDRALLVLHALADEPDGEALLTDAERERLDEARPDLDAALARHPGLAAAARRIRDDRAAFDRAWAQALVPTGPPAHPRATPTRQRPASRAADRSPYRPARPTRWAWRVVALAAVVAFAGVLATLWTRDAGWDRIAAAERQTVGLADGSTVTLAVGAVLEVPPAGAGDRQARLRNGEALFRIVHDPGQPFTLTTANAEITVLGTTFGVEAREARTDVVLVEGAVALAPRAMPAEAVRLAPGERSHVLALDAPAAPRPADVGAALAWTGEPFGRSEMAQATADRIAARFGVTVTVDDALAAEPVAPPSGADGAEDALRKLAKTLGGRLDRNADGSFHIAEGDGR